MPQTRRLTAIDNIDQLDLNLLQLLRAIVLTGSTRAAAERLGISQASASRGMTKLKATFGDQLFIRKAHGMEPSELALRLTKATDLMLEPVKEALSAYHQFDPLAYQGDIAIVVDPYVLQEQGPQLANYLRTQYPNASVAITGWGTASIEQLLQGSFDYCICDQETSLPQEIYLQQLYQEPMKVLARKDHPVLSQVVASSWQQLAELAVVILPPPDGNHRPNYVELEYQQHGLRVNVMLATTSILAGLACLSESNAIMYANPSTAKLHSDIRCYPLAQASAQFSLVKVYGGMLQRRRNHPFYQHLHQGITKLFG
ncbi:LysR family transcriptional regulator [Neiella marina]|uniref:LysR family transcriptional regulator n=1 Tax=Neiella marina TaxID=508461 RepID=A0A8J2U4X0_9GAMM|nr:LysR family transcriptional regulator [Neiella marina]GGA76179.1 LysR family transcriptional regulator [Neiella marina]